MNNTTASIDCNVQFRISEISQGRVSEYIGKIDYNIPIASGTGNYEANSVYYNTHTVDSSGVLELDLSDLSITRLGHTHQMSYIGVDGGRIVAHRIINQSPTTLWAKWPWEAGFSPVYGSGDRMMAAPEGWNLSGGDRVSFSGTSIPQTFILQILGSRRTSLNTNFTFGIEYLGDPSGFYRLPTEYKLEMSGVTGDLNTEYLISTSGESTLNFEGLSEASGSVPINLEYLTEISGNSSLNVEYNTSVSGDYGLNIEYRSSGIASSSTETFNSSTSWICPSGITSVTVECWGAGGGGCHGGANGGGGGGGGAYSSSVVAVTPTTSYTISIGSGGNSGSPASAGGDTYFNTSLTVMAKGGGGGTTLSGGTGGLFTSGVGTVRRNGGAGYYSGTASGGGGGSSAGTSANGNSATSFTGATAPTGGGSGGSGGLTALPGSLGNAPGGGAGGGGNGANGSVGAAGRIKLTY